MPNYRKHETWEEHPKRDERSTRKRITQTTMYIPTLESHKSRKYHKRRREEITNRNTIDEDLF
jgi:hypothetical protein